ncbi:MAG: DUF420 domain-containing protein [Bacteroidetes bacterium]|nr:DUF420 domain-containing protein [Bacteroidota bacterium]
MTLNDLPLLNATLNATASVLLLTARKKIRNREIEAHKKLMIASVCVSALFLASYLTYHFAVHLTVPFRDPVWFRPIYLTILLTHTLLAATVPVLVAITLVRGLKRKDALHRKIAKWTYPIWLYVSVTGVVIYLLLYQIFPQVIS